MGATAPLPPTPGSTPLVLPKSSNILKKWIDNFLLIITYILQGRKSILKCGGGGGGDTTWFNFCKTWLFGKLKIVAYCILHVPLSPLDLRPWYPFAMPTAWRKYTRVCALYLYMYTLLRGTLLLDHWWHMRYPMMVNAHINCYTYIMERCRNIIYQSCPYIPTNDVKQPNCQQAIPYLKKWIQFFIIHINSCLYNFCTPSDMKQRKGQQAIFVKIIKCYYSYKLMLTHFFTNI